MQNLVTLGLKAIQGEFQRFPYIIPCKTCDPRGGVKFDPKGYNLKKKKLDRDPLGKATWQIW